MKRALVGLAILIVAGLFGSWAMYHDILDALTERFILADPRVRAGDHAVETSRRIGFQTSDGVRLNADVHRPVGPAKTPTILVRIPLTNTFFNRLRTDAIGRYWAARGYAVVVQGTRGRYESGGDFYPLSHERRDGLETLRWLSRQPWYDGRLAMWGGSSFGHTQWAVSDQVEHGPQALFVQIASSRFREMFYPGGAFSLESALYWAVRSRGDRDRDVDIADLDRAAGVLPIVDADDVAIGDTDFFNDWVLKRDDDDYWRAIDGRDRPGQLKAPVLLMAGWYDPFLPGQLRDFQDILARADPTVADRTRLIVGPWGHATEVRLPGQDEPTPYRSESVVRMIPWADEMLGLAPAAGAPKVSLFVMGVNEWRAEKEWPLARTRYVRFYLHSGGRANTSAGDGALAMTPPDGAQPPDRFDYDPRDPVPSAGGAMLGERSGPKLQNAVEGRSDVLVYTSEPMARATEVTGPVSAEIFVASDAPSTDFTAKLVDVHPDGSAYNLASGIRRVEPAGAGAGDVIAPRPIRIELWPTSNVFLPGHRIRLEISSSNFPRFDRNPNTSEPAATATAVRVAAQTIFHSHDRPSYVLLPIIP